MAVVFKCMAGDIGIEVEGPEEFVRDQVGFLLPWVRQATGAAEPAPGVEGGPAQAAPPGIEGLPWWWRRTMPAGVHPSLQDTILIFALYMRTYRKTVFVSEDIRRAFSLMGTEEPKSLLQILGTLKRDQGMLLSAGKRGEYMMSIPGINRARGIAGVMAGPLAAGAGPAPGTGVVDAMNIFKD